MKTLINNLTLGFTALLIASASQLIATTPTRYELPKDGRVSLAVYDQHGLMVRTLLSSEAQAAGKHEATWDGLDGEGHAVAVGDYQWKLLLGDGYAADPGAAAILKEH